MSIVFRFSGITTLDGNTAAPAALPADTQVVRQAGGNYMVQRTGGVAILTLGKIDLNILVNLAFGRNTDDVLVSQVAAIDNNGIPAAVLVNVGADVGNAEHVPLLNTFRSLGPAVDQFTEGLPVYTSQLLLVGGTIGLGPWGLSIVCFPFALQANPLNTLFQGIT